MRNTPFQATPRQAARDERSAKSPIGTSWPARGAAPAGLIARRLGLLAGCSAAGVLLAGALLSTLPLLYEAVSRVLLSEAADPQIAALLANSLARTIEGGTLIAPPAPPTFSSSPPGLIILLAGGGLGLAVGAVGMALLAVNPRQFTRAEDVETASGLPVIALVPELEDGAGALSHVLRDPGSSYANSLRKLYEKLHSDRWTEAPKVVAISSALPGEGRSTLAASLGRLLASEGCRVLLVDCDWRQPKLHKMFQLDNETGLAALLADPRASLDDVIHTDALSGLDIITAGRRNLASVHKLISEPMRKILTSLAGGYDLVLLDMPPVLAADETLPLSSLADKLIFAIRWRHTLQRKAIDAMEKILAARGDLVGVVFTRVDLDRYRKSRCWMVNPDFSDP